MNSPVIILIFTHKPRLEWYEAISLRQCVRVLGAHPMRLVCPEGLDIAAYQRLAPELREDIIPGRWLSSVRAYNRFKILPFLYRRYADFEYMLTYELDAFVFRDELLRWCSEGWDYIGAPWFEGWSATDSDAKPIGVGNSGFSLRRVPAMLRVNRSWKLIRPARDVYSEWRICNRMTPRGMLRLLRTLLASNNFFAALNGYQGNEDVFWGIVAPSRFAWLRVAPYEVARHFSFEMNPEKLFNECGGQLPFGCHKWMADSLGFWRDKIAALGYEIPQDKSGCGVEC